MSVKYGNKVNLLFPLDIYTVYSCTSSPMCENEVTYKTGSTQQRRQLRTAMATGYVHKKMVRLCVLRYASGQRDNRDAHNNTLHPPCGEVMKS